LSRLDKPSIAVLPFKNLSADPDQEFFADGITEDIITELLRDKDLFLEEVTIAIRHNPNHPHWYLIAPGRALFMLKRYEEAVPFLERLVNASEDASTFRALLAATYMALGR
jgi:predicted Zn-dependent protease